jgi:hypothetical protein
VQHTVVAVAQPKPGLERLDVNVAGLGLDGAGDDLVDQPDDRGVAGQVAQPLGVFLDRGGGALDDLLTLGTTV